MAAAAAAMTSTEEGTTTTAPPSSSSEASASLLDQLLMGVSKKDGSSDHKRRQRRRRPKRLTQIGKGADGVIFRSSKDPQLVLKVFRKVSHAVREFEALTHVAQAGGEGSSFIIQPRAMFTWHDDVLKEDCAVMVIPRYDLDGTRWIDSCSHHGTMKHQHQVRAQKMCVCILHAIAACHAAGTAHCDIKIENALLRPKQDLAVLCDFSHAQRRDAEGTAASPEGTLLCSMGLGTVETSAPEMYVCPWQHSDSDDDGRSSKTSEWSEWSSVRSDDDDDGGGTAGLSEDVPEEDLEEGEVVEDVSEEEQAALERELEGLSVEDEEEDKWDGTPYDAFKADIWSFGVFVWNLTTPDESCWEVPSVACPRYAKLMASSEALDRQLRQSGIPKEAREIILRCLRLNPAERPSAAELLASSWAKKYAPSLPAAAATATAAAASGAGGSKSADDDSLGYYGAVPPAGYSTPRWEKDAAHIPSEVLQAVQQADFDSSSDESSSDEEE